MPFGIGGGGFMGVALEQLPPPVQSALATATTGGTITAGTYKYVVTAINASGETTASNEQTIATTGSTSTVTVTWVAVPGATGYKLYKTAAGGATGSELLYKTVGAVTSDIDTTPGTPTGVFPAINTAQNPNVYVAPLKFFPFRSESLKYQQETIWRRPIRQNVDVLGGVAGNVHVEGDLEIEALEDVVPYFHFATRAICVKTGTSPNFVYTFTPSSAGSPPSDTMSITVVRNGQVFGYVGCVVGGFKYSIDSGLLICSYSIVGSDEASQTLPVPTYPTTVPFGAGQYNIQIPTASQVFDVDTFEFDVADNAEPQYRLKSSGRGAQFIKYGERQVTITMERDFLDRADYDSYKALTSQSLTLLATKGANNSIQIDAPAMIKDTYEVGLSGQGDLVRSSLTYQGTYDAGTSKAYSLTVKTQENVT